MACFTKEYKPDSRKMLMKEFRVVLPLTVDEYKVAQLWSVAEASKNETGGGEGIEVVKNEPYDETDKPEGMGKGQYTYKIYHLASRVPRFIKTLAPKGSLEFHEEAWNAYPYCRTIVSNPEYMKTGFEIKIETWHLPDAGTTENPHKLNKKQFNDCEKVLIDIANDPVAASDYKPEFDPLKVASKKAGRGPLYPGWIEKLQDEEKSRRKSQSGENGASNVQHMCAYKLVSCHFKWWGLQNRVESMIQKQERRLFTTFHRQVYGWMDKWYGLTMEDIRRLEEETKKDLDNMRKTGEIRGTKVED